MKAARAEVLADMLAEIATRLEQAEGKGRDSAARNLPGALANDPRLVGVFIEGWLREAAVGAAAEIRHVAERLRPACRRNRR